MVKGTQAMRKEESNAYRNLAIVSSVKYALSVQVKRPATPSSRLEQLAQDARPLSKGSTYSMPIQRAANDNYYGTGYDEYRAQTPYIQKHIERKEDHTEKVPLKSIHHMWPESIMGGILGFTYIGENFMGRRDDLTGWWARMVDIHESIHTPDEYETRVLTDHIMDKTPPKYLMIPQFILPKAEYRVSK